MNWGAVAGGVLAVGCVAGIIVVGCNASSQVSCSPSATDPSSCTCAAGSAPANDLACPSADAGASVCCASAQWPAAGQCDCSPSQVGCAYGNQGCVCGLMTAKAHTLSSCEPASEWASCCSSSSGCTCTLLPDAGCDGVVVTSCSAQDIDGGTCALGTVTCTCSAGGLGQSVVCGTPTVTCCLAPALHVPGDSTCTCSLGVGTCPSGSTFVPSCNPSLVADAAVLDLCAFQEEGGTVVPSCGPGPAP